MTTQPADLRYDPYDIAIDTDPHPIWRRMRDEAPIYRNDEFDFWALSRFDDVEAGLVDHATYTSGRGTILELIQHEIPVPPGLMLFEDPPVHDVHRSLLSRVFTPKKMTGIEPQVRAFCAQELDDKIGSGRFDFVRDIAAFVPMRVIGMLLGIPESDQAEIRAGIEAAFDTDERGEVRRVGDARGESEVFADYLDWRVEHPSDDLMTDLLTVEFEDETGTVRRLTREEVLTYVTLINAAGNETTTRLIGWTGKLLGEHPDQCREIAADRRLVPQAIEEILRYEAPSPVQARYVARDVEHHGQRIPAGSTMLLLNGSANRDDRRFPDGDRFDIHRTAGHHLSFGYGLHFCLGAALARLEGRVVLDEVLQRWTSWEVDWDHAVQAHSSTTRGWARVPVVAS